MRPVHSLFIIVCLFMTDAAVSTAGDAGECSLRVRSASGASIGRIDSNGYIRNASGATAGRFYKNHVRNKSGKTIGRVDSDGSIRAASGATIGRVDNDGRLRNASGATIGRIDKDGRVRNRSGAICGRFDGYTPACRLTAAAYLFFFEPMHVSGG